MFLGFSNLRVSVKSILTYFLVLTVGFHEVSALFGFFLFVILGSQIISGILLAIGYIPEPTLVPIIREEEALESLYTDDLFFLHERGVDYLFIFCYIHLLRKLYIQSYTFEQEAGWKSGIFLFLIFQGVTFFGLLLCVTHLSEITLTIAANIFHTFFGFIGKAYWWPFPDKSLNADTLVRVCYLHYAMAGYFLYAALLHGIDLHYDWKNTLSYDGIEVELSWLDEALANELSRFLCLCVLFTFICIYLYPEPESVSYELFMWGDIGIIVDVRFYGVAPHWYFRPFMAWLIVCPHHKLGIGGLICFFFALFYQPSLSYVRLIPLKKNITVRLNKREIVNIESNLMYQFAYVSFLIALAYTTTFLPYGRFFNRLGGNDIMLVSYLYVLLFLFFKNFRSSSLFLITKFGFLFKTYRFFQIKFV